jgi:hypothetical protein
LLRECANSVLYFGWRGYIPRVLRCDRGTTPDTYATGQLEQRLVVRLGHPFTTDGAAVHAVVMEATAASSTIPRRAKMPMLLSVARGS